jgi:hypothetical protein
MSKPSRRLHRQWLNEKKIERRKAAKKLRQQQAAAGLDPKARPTISNGMSVWETVKEEREARQEAVEEKLKMYRAVLPKLNRKQLTLGLPTTYSDGAL